MKHTAWISLISTAIMLTPAVASADLLDQLNEATKKLNQASQQQNSQQTQVAQARSSGGGSLSSGLGATDAQGWTNFNGCMAQTSGAQEKLTAQVLQRKLDQSKNLSSQQRRNLEEDIQWLNAKAAGSRLPPPDPKNPQRYLLALTDEEQMEITSANNRFASEVREKCDAQYGGMSQFADPAGRRRAPIDTRVALPDLRYAAPPPTQRPLAREPQNNCMASLQGLRWRLMAERMERKLQGLPNLSAQERKAWDEDIALVRAAAAGGATTMPQSPDPKNPVRYLSRLPMDDQVALNQDYASRSQEIMASCRGGGSPTSQWSMATSRTEQARAEARAGAQRAPAQAADAANAAAQAWLDAHPMTAPRPAASTPAVTGGGSLSAALGAARADYLERLGAVGCFDRGKGFRAKQTADRLATKRGSVSARDRQDLEAWISAWRAAEEARLDEPIPPNPGDSQGYYKFLTNADQQELNMAYSALQNKIRDECNAIDHMGVGDRKRP